MGSGTEVTFCHKVELFQDGARKRMSAESVSSHKTLIINYLTNLVWHDWDTPLEAYMLPRSVGSGACLSGHVPHSDERVFEGNPVDTVGLQYRVRLKEAGIVCGESAAVQALNAMVEDLAGTNIPVLLMGESGTGKEVYARILHWLSGENGRPLKKITCAAMDAARLQSELQKELVQDGDAREARHLFLDGIEELDSACQRVLLGFLPEAERMDGHFAPQVRLISATSRDLEKEVESGRFRRELYFRINGVCLRLPPLRERKEDLAALLDHFLQKHEQEMKKPTPPIGEDTFAALLAYDWPGNIRELENLVRKMVALGNTQLAINDLRMTRGEQFRAASPERGSSLKIAARAASRQRERELILEALERTKWNRKRAAHELQISYKALLYKLRQIGAPGQKRRNEGANDEESVDSVFRRGAHVGFASCAGTREECNASGNSCEGSGDNGKGNRRRRI